MQQIKEGIAGGLARFCEECARGGFEEEILEALFQAQFLHDKLAYSFSRGVG